MFGAVSICVPPDRSLGRRNWKRKRKQNRKKTDGGCSASAMRKKKKIDEIEKRVIKIDDSV